MEFALSNEQPTDVTFRAEIDRDGDLMLFANGHKLLFIDNCGGTLCRIHISNEGRAALPGFEFDSDDRVALLM